MKASPTTRLLGSTVTAGGPRRAWLPPCLALCGGLGLHLLSGLQSPGRSQPRRVLPATRAFLSLGTQDPCPLATFRDTSHQPLPAGSGLPTPSFLPSLSLKRAQGLLQPPPDTLQPQPCPVANTFSHPGFPESLVSWGAPPVGSQHNWFF